MLRRGAFIGLRISELRRRNGLSRTDLAEKLDCSSRDVFRYEHGLAVPPLAIILRLSSLFGCPLEYFYSSSRNTRDFSRGIRAQKGKLASSWVQSRDEE